MPLNEQEYHLLIAACKRRWGANFDEKKIDVGLELLDISDVNDFDPRIFAVRMGLSEKDGDRMAKALARHGYAAVMGPHSCEVTTDGLAEAARQVRRLARQRQLGASQPVARTATNEIASTTVLCSRCGHAGRDAAAFCAHCGNKRRNSRVGWRRTEGRAATWKAWELGVICGLAAAALARLAGLW